MKEGTSSVQSQFIFRSLANQILLPHPLNLITSLPTGNNPADNHADQNLAVADLHRLTGVAKTPTKPLQKTEALI